ncbi:MAG: c-type cytochrome [Arcobacteraceae bacterium]
MKKIAISLVAVGMIIFTGCSDEKEKSSTYVEQKAPNVMSQEEKSNLIDKAKEEASKVAEQVKESTSTIVDEVKKEATPMVESVKEDVTEKMEAVQAQVASATAKVSSEVEQKVEAVTQAMTPQKSKGAELYAKCAACHGQNAEKKALGTSQIIKGWSVEQTVSSLKGYQNKTYGGNMKTIMIGQVANLSDEDIEALAQHISSL